METNTSQDFAQMKESNQSYHSVKNIEIIEGSPFGIVEVNHDGENKHFIAIGNKRLSKLQSKEECEDSIANKDWDLITQLCIHIVENADLIAAISNAVRKTGLPDESKQTKD